LVRRRLGGKSSGQCGEIRAGALISLALLAFVVYESFKFVPVMFAQYSFKDAVVEEAKFAVMKKAETVRDSLLKRAQELNLPIEAGMIKVTRQPTRTRIEVNYRLSVEWLPGKVYSWDVNESTESQHY
jgi:hypothetical protein